MSSYLNNCVSAENYPVLLKRGSFVDPDREGREVPYKMYHPDVEAGTSTVLPLIIWSHGFGGNRDGASFLSRFLARHGYIILHLTHRGTDSSIWEGKDGHPWDILRKYKTPRIDTLNRFYDVPFVLSQLECADEEQFPVKSLIDFSSIGMSGHSFGAMTTQVMAGQRFPDEKGNLIQIKEPRFKAGLLYSPVSIAHLSDASPEALYGPIDIPIMHMTGTDDDSPIEKFGYEHRLVIHEHTHSPYSFLLVKNHGDHMVYNGTRGKLEANPYREKHEEIIKTFALAFWDAFLKNNHEALEFLCGAQAQDFIGSDGQLAVRQN